MRIGIDCRTILHPEAGEKAGVGHYTYYLVRQLLKIDSKNEYVLYFDHHYPQPKEFLAFPNVQVRHMPFSRYKRYLPYVQSHILISAQLKRDQLDVFHTPANIIPQQYSGVSVVTIHDLAIYRHPEWFPDGQEFAKKVLVPSSLERASRIIAVSQSTKKDMIDLFGVSAKKIDVIYEGANKEGVVTRAVVGQIRRRYALAPHYVFFIGVLEPRKNLSTLIKAFDAIVHANWKKYKDWQLVLAGAKGWKYANIMSAIKDAKAGAQIRYIGYVSHEEKVSLLKGADVFAFPSLWEGFGLPVLEAMQAGVPVLTSRVSAIPEVTGSAAVLVNPKKVKEVQAGLLVLMNSESKRQTFAVAGKVQAKQFSWTRCARETLKVYAAAAKT